MLAARISLTLSRHSSLSFIALGRSSGQQPVSSHSCWMYVRAGRPAFARPCVGIHKSTSLMSSSLLLQQCPACLVRLTWIVFVIGGRWQYSWCLVGCCCQDLFRIARSILINSLFIYESRGEIAVGERRIVGNEIRIQKAPLLSISFTGVWVIKSLLINPASAQYDVTFLLDWLLSSTDLSLYIFWRPHFLSTPHQPNSWAFPLSLVYL